MSRTTLLVVPFGALLALLSTAACSGEQAQNGGTSASSSGSGATSCSELAATCAQTQQGCVEGAAGPSCQPCGAGNYATAAGGCDPIGGTALAHDFPMNSIAAGGEQLGNCRSWTVDNTSDLWVNAVELTQDEESHHSNWVFVPVSSFDGPDGIWKCSDRSYDFYTAVNAGGLLYAQSTQATHEVQKFAEGAAIHVPAKVRIISDIHLLNTSKHDTNGHAKLTLYTVAASEVKAQLSAFHIEYDALDLPPLAASRFTASCAVASDVAKAMGKPFAPKVHYALPHTHNFATGFFAAVKGGQSDGAKLLDLGVYNGEAHGRTFDPPIDMTGADGFTFYCQYLNTTSKDIGWGFGGSEMCEMFGFAEGSAFFQARVGTGHAEGTSGVVELFGGDCETQVFTGK